MILSLIIMLSKSKIKIERGFFSIIYEIHLNGNLEFLMLVLRTIIFISDFYTSGTDHGREGTWIWASTAQ